ncbi:MAG: hypothetical protein ABFC85_03825 [Rectinema sp.]|jgi:hypothetical protein
MVLLNARNLIKSYKDKKIVCIFYSSYTTMTLGSIAAFYCIHCLGTLLFSSLFFMLVASIKRQDTFNRIFK